MGGRFRRTEAGFTYIAILLAVALHSAVLAAVGILWHTAQKRENERELLFVGDQFRNAIRSYGASGAGAAGVLPQSLDDLLRDPRTPNVTRHLRKIFVDPMTGKAEWGLVKTPDGKGISGVYSLSEEEPLKVANFSEDDRGFQGKKRYSDWKFVSGTTAIAGDTGSQRPTAPTAPGALPPGMTANPAPDTGATPATGTPATGTPTTGTPATGSPVSRMRALDPQQRAASPAPPPAAPQPDQKTAPASSSPFSTFGPTPLQSSPFASPSPQTPAAPTPAPKPGTPASAPAAPATPASTPATPTATPATPAEAPAAAPAAPAATPEPPAPETPTRQTQPSLPASEPQAPGEATETPSQ